MQVMMRASLINGLAFALLLGCGGGDGNNPPPPMGDGGPPMGDATVPPVDAGSGPAAVYAGYWRIDEMAAAGMTDGEVAEGLIRPEALILSPAAAGEEGTQTGQARVLASRMLGRTSLVHLCTCQQSGEELHLHARVPGRFLPPEDEVLQVTLDSSQAFVFPPENR